MSNTFEELKKKTEDRIALLRKRRKSGIKYISTDVTGLVDYLTDILVFLEVFENATEVIPTLHETAGPEQ